MSQPFLEYDTARAIADNHGTPVHVYDVSRIRESAQSALAFPVPYGLTVRYAVKAASTRALLQIFNKSGLHFDASSVFEARRIIMAGIAPERISLSTQELPENITDLVKAGVSINACSLRQIATFGKAFPGQAIGLRFNPGLGSGSTNRTNVGGPASSFGIWHEHLEKARTLVSQYGLKVFRIHTHIGSGSDPEVWKRASALSLRIAAEFPSVTHFNMGGGFKVARMAGEQATRLQEIGPPIASLLERFAREHGRELHMEIEPGTYLMANAGAILSRVQDVVTTSADGYTFLKLDCGMTEVLRPSLYGAQHPISLLQEVPSGKSQPAIVVGHCCESGDILTPAEGDPEALLPRELPLAHPGDLALINDTGAYCSAMSAANYNSFPQAPEVLLYPDHSFSLIRRRQTLEQIVQNELDPDLQSPVHSP